MKFGPMVCILIIWKYIYITQKCAYADIYEDITLSTVEIIRKYGYPVEVYSNITTEDNYLLDIYRIPNGRSVSHKVSRNPVLLMPGLARTSRDYVVLGPERALAFLLADKGYDVWLGNSRSTTYSRKHLTLNPDVDREFWNFSWHEMGIYDLPAMFELMKKVTKKERFSYIGISQGTTLFYVMTSTRPEYNRNVSISISLAPGVYYSHSNPLVRMLARFEPVFTPLLNMTGVNEILSPPIAQLLQVMNRVLCTRKDIFQDICASLIYITSGYDPIQLDKTTVPLVAGLEQGGSIRELAHLAQNINMGLFRKYDFGKEDNLKKYGSVHPPLYNLSKVTAPNALIYSEGDWLGQPLDAERLCKELPNCVDMYKVPFRQFNHVDFLIAKDVIKLVFKKVFDLLETYNKIIIT